MEPFSGKPEDVARVLASADIDRRLKGLEDDIERLEAHQLDRHARTITIIFSFMTVFVGVCAILVTLLGWFSKSETREATKDMEAKVDKAVTAMQGQFQALAGESLKKPNINILGASGPLNGQVFEYDPNDGRIKTGPIFLNNTGDRRTDTLSIRLYSALQADVSQPANATASHGWYKVASADPNYPHCWYFNPVNESVDPDELWPLIDSIHLHLQVGVTNYSFRLMVYYGREKPAQAEFTARPKRP